MSDRYTSSILRHIADTRYEPRTLRQLAQDLGVADDEFDQFKAAADALLEDGCVILGSSDTIALPPPGKEMVGVFRAHEKGFGFLQPDELTQHGDLFIPPGATGDAMNGDRVRAKVIHEGKRAGSGKSPFVGRIIEVIQRVDRQYVGTLLKRGKLHVVQVDGRLMRDPVIIRDATAKNARVGDKVVIEIVEYPKDANDVAEGVITEVLGEGGEPQVETLSVIRAYGLAEKFPQEVTAEARKVSQAFDPDKVPDDREDLTGVLTLTIDPPTAKDYDDAISIRSFEEGGRTVTELGVHIADVAHFVTPDSALDKEAYARGNSTYLPRVVVPMLPEVLSNGVCSLQEGVNRYAKSCFMKYDADGKVLSERFARSVIRSDKRLTYLEAQALIDGDLREAIKHTKTEPKYPKPITDALKQMDELAKRIRARRLEQGMIVLGLPEVELIFDDTGRVVDAEPEDNAFTHTLIEMFMVEANEATARLFDRADVPMIRRIHPDPDAHGIEGLRMFARVAGYNIPARPSRKQLQTLLEAVRGKPAQRSVNMAVLRTLSKAEYSPMLVGHFALASEHYTHFTSPIRRYPDLVIHRGIDAYLAAAADSGKRPKARGIGKKLMDKALVPDEMALREIGRHCSATERNSESAERELRNYLVLELLSEHIGEDYDGTVTGVTGNGVYIQIDKYLVDGFVRSSDLPGTKNDRWKLNPKTGALVAQRSGATVSIGNTFTVRVAAVDLARRVMDLSVIDSRSDAKAKRKKLSPSKAKAATKLSKFKHKKNKAEKRNKTKKSKHRKGRR
ncbi:MAG: ribonuclease R [Phycisphaerales bacterium]